MNAPAPVSASGLYGAPNSPFTLRVQLAARAKGIALPDRPVPAGGLRSPEFLALNPAAKIPVLVTKSGLAIRESGVILEYLEDLHPRPATLPADPGERAFMRTVIAMTDRYFMAPVIRLFPHLDPAKRDPLIVANEVARWCAGLRYLDQVLFREMAPVDAPLSMGDCVLAPSFHLSARIAAMIGLPEDPLCAFPNLVRYFTRVRHHKIVDIALAELTNRQEEKDLIAGLPSIAHRH